VCSSDLIYEIHLSLAFDDEQTKKLKRIANIWSDLLYEDLGYKEKPAYTIIKLGLEKFEPDLSWESVIEILTTNLPENNKSLISIKKAVEACS